MLILTRKKGETIQIGDNIEITITAIKGDQVKIGINAPSNIDIYRKEVYLNIQEENQKASELSSNLLWALSNEMKNKQD